MRDHRGMMGRKRGASVAGGGIRWRWLLGGRVGKGWRRGLERRCGGRRMLRVGLDWEEALGLWEIPVMPDCIFRY